MKSADLEADAALLRHAFESLHPGLYRYANKAQMDGHFAELEAKLRHDQSLQEAFLASSQFAAEVRCGHTFANPLNQPKSLADSLLKTPTRLPFYFEWLDRQMVVTRDFTPEGTLPVGTRVVRVNGVSTHDILAKLMTIARADGSNDSKRVAQLAVTGSSAYETFDVYYPMFFPETKPALDLVVRTPGSTHTEHRSVKPLTFDQRVAPIRVREAQKKGGSDALFDWKYLPDGSAYLKMSTWALFDSKWNWKQWLNDHLEEATTRNAPMLIVDVRGNEGGLDVGNEILPHLIASPIELSSMQRLVRYRTVPDDLNPHLDTWNKGFRNWGAAAVDLSEPWPTAPADGTYLKLTRNADDETGDRILPSTTRFRGKVVVLIDASNSSATFGFAQNLQQHHLATLVGQPTGGSQRGINGGGFFFLRLPHSGVELDLPLIGTFPTTPMPDAGITPDVPVRRSADDLAHGRDPEMDAALALRQTHP